MQDDGVTFTLKNYQKGLSQKLSNASEDVDTFEVKGPIGKGLDLKGSGTHVVFTSGTGILVFLDLITHLILK